MKTKNKISALVIMCLIIIGSTIFTACNKDEDLDTNQMDNSKITLKSFGPSPAMRGGELRFIGTNLDKVTSIDLPGAEGITDITDVSKYEIRITIPQTAEPGYVTLNTPEGKITTLTTISYSEPISISDFSPKSAKAGATIKIEGDYLNIVQEVIFSDNVHVLKADFVSQSREALEVILPEEAQTGKIIVSDGADLLSNGEDIPSWIYTEEDIVVTLPSISGLSPNPVKAGEKLTINGADLDLVAKVILPGGTEVEVADATNKIEITETPNDLKEGVVTLVAKSGVEVTSNELKLVKPIISSVSGTTIKNGTSFTINGSDLDLVSEIAFQGATVAKADFTSASASQLVLNIPATVTDGTFTLKTLSETETTGQSLTCVVPAISNISPVEIKAKETLTITGTDLDLTAKVIFGSVEGTIESTGASTLTVTVPVGATTGAVTIVTVNGTEVASSQTLTINVTLPVITSITSTGPGGIITVEGTDLNIIKTIYLADSEGNYTIPVTDYGIKSATYLEFYHIKGSAEGYITPLMVTVDGDEGYMPEVYCGGTDPVLDETYVFFDFNNTGAKDSWWGNAINSGILDDSENSADGSSFWNIEGMSGTGWWDGLFFRNGNNNYVTDGIDVSKDVYKFDVTIRKTIYEGRLQLRLGDYSYYWAPWDGNVEGYKTEGWISIEIPLTEFKDGSGNSIPNAADGGKEFGMIWSWGVSVEISMGIDNVRFEKK